MDSTTHTINGRTYTRGVDGYGNGFIMEMRHGEWHGEPAQTVAEGQVATIQRQHAQLAEYEQLFERDQETMAQLRAQLAECAAVIQTQNEAYTELQADYNELAHSHQCAMHKISRLETDAAEIERRLLANDIADVAALPFGD